MLAYFHRSLHPDRDRTWLDETFIIIFFFLFCDVALLMGWEDWITLVTS